jgi:peptide/nickel transport system permease protein
LTYIVRRLLLLIPVLIGVTILTFMITRAAGDPTLSYLQNPDRASPQAIEEIREKYHLDEPIYIQYIYWLNGLLHGDLGYTHSANNLPVTTAIAMKFPATFELAIVSTILSVLGGIYLGTISAVKANSPLDQSTRVLSLTAVSIPVFWLGLILLMVFYNQLGWLPGPTGRYDTVQYSLGDLHPIIGFNTNFLLIDTVLSGNASFFWDVVLHLVLPSVTLAFASTAIIIRMMRSSMLEVLNAEYVRTARSKGLPESVVIKKHARRNALIPTTTVIGLSFGGLLGGAVLTETVFNWPGLGQWAALAARSLDTAGILGFTLLTAMIYVLANLVVDIVYAYLDPRVRLG